MRQARRVGVPALSAALVAAGVWLSVAPLRVAADGPYASPCDATPQLPLCIDALGPLLDVTLAWRAYQPALVQPIPISDYATDPEDRPPPLGVGTCGGERSAPSSDGTPIPASAPAASPPQGIPAPPGTHGPYCVLRYIADDFTSLCATCHRLLFDYAATPASGTATSPPADGHWAGRLQWSLGQQLSAQIDGHSPNIKNLCSDKFVNPAPGATCSATTSSLDRGFLEVEGDTSIYHHFPFEGRYYNGPRYLAGDGSAVPYHWVRGAFLDVDAAAVQGAGTVWYQLGYRGLGDVAPDTDQSYGCACEVPPLGHTAMSRGYGLAVLPAHAGTTEGATASPSPTSGSLANTGALLPSSASAAALAAAAGVAVAARARRRRAGRRRR
jgi:hypothetical protein